MTTMLGEEELAALRHNVRLARWTASGSLALGIGVSTSLAFSPALGGGVLVVWFVLVALVARPLVRSRYSCVRCGQRFANLLRLPARCPNCGVANHSRAEPEGATTTSLIVGNWVVVALAEAEQKSADNPDAPTFRMESTSDGWRIAGSTGCNRFSGPMQLTSDDGLRVPAVATTRRACADPGKAEGERQLLAALAAARRVVATPGTLELRDSTGQAVLRARRLQGPTQTL